MEKISLEQWLISKGYEKDSFGHYKKTKLAKNGNMELYRYKLGKYSARYKVRVNHEAGQYSAASHSWLRLRSNYYKHLSINADNKLEGMKK